jgi:hypothetical protein
MCATTGEIVSKTCSGNIAHNCIIALSPEHYRNAIITYILIASVYGQVTYMIVTYIPVHEIDYQLPLFKIEDCMQ